MSMVIGIGDNGGNLLLDSREVSQLTSTRHDHLLAKIDGFCKVIAIDPKFRVNDFFIEGTYTDSIGRTLKKYDCTKMGCSMIANKMTGEKGVLFTAAYVTKFEQMETKLSTINKKVPSYMIDDPIKRAETWIEERKETINLENKIALAAPKLRYVDVILQSKSTVTTTQIGKDYALTGQELNKILKDEGVQYKQNGQWLLYKKYQDRGYHDSFTMDILHKDGSVEVKMVSRWTQRGRMFIHELLHNLGIKPNIEKEYGDVK